MNIYFTASIRGGRAEQPSYEQILKLIERYGSVLSGHVADESISNFGETEFTKEEIYEREIENLKQCDIVVAEITTPSLGVGYMIAKATDMNKEIICLYHEKNTDKLSAIIHASPKTKVILYESAEDIQIYLKKLFKKND
ncbi:MAG: nucleoside 2-deoxyribosyltransferase [Candidatus Magasanikbacteria bacterium CG_4_10_14_0_2_um_filter_37_12]|uniref:Putative 2'-deoxynucleoside 5'-phosphate N-hydrolase 1 n=1 Tax=Candidatus Magasanikbacteria bacterium CG_4_10_14_0_2_um_filter_37_12 TaxID=1974637 RepID=A0A2M7V6G9_9BACT|nr:MAG: nucleoside 2-deoxyribosyltransferase [Candidatus Magasanikbacteria bacterium CG_4_10_14_0_2_um_filter_37_12]